MPLSSRPSTVHKTCKRKAQVTAPKFYLGLEEMPFEKLLQECGEVAKSKDNAQAFVVYKNTLSSKKSRCWLCKEGKIEAKDLRDSSQTNSEVHWIEEVAEHLSNCEDLNKKMEVDEKWRPRIKEIKHKCAKSGSELAEQCWREQCSALTVHVNEISKDAQGLQCAMKTQGQGEAKNVRISLAPKKVLTDTGGWEFTCVIPM
jgi:hypothetical protein